MVTEQLVEDLLTLWRLLRRATHPVSRDEMTPEQYWLLRVLNRRGPLSIGELADALGISPSSATTACKRLERVGWVRRERQAADERMVHVALTDEGLAQIEIGRRRRRDLLAGLLGVLSSEEQEQMQRLIGRILTAADEREAAGVGVTDAADPVRGCN